METLQLLAVALGFASLCGINLYLTVFVTGLAVRFEWITLAEPYTHFAVLADPVILTISGILFAAEFFADKVPWVDTMWDTVHTVIRPVGAALLAITVLGEPSPVFDVIVGLLAGGTALTTHAVKSTSRLVVNASPEPFSNIGLSLAEDGVVLGGLALLAWNPLVGLGLVAIGVGLAWILGPKVWRLLRSRAGFAWRKLTVGAREEDKALPQKLPVEIDCALHQQTVGTFRLDWALPVTVGRLKGVPSNCRGWLVANADRQPALSWVGRVWFRTRLKPLAEGSRARWKYLIEPGFLFDKLSIYDPSQKQPAVFFLDRSSRERADRVLREFFSAPATVAAPAGGTERPASEQTAEATAKEPAGV
jgi:hypothetical protein